MKNFIRSLFLGTALIASSAFAQDAPKSQPDASSTGFALQHTAQCDTLENVLAVLKAEEFSIISVGIDPGVPGGTTRFVVAYSKTHDVMLIVTVFGPETNYAGKACMAASGAKMTFNFDALDRLKAVAQTPPAAGTPTK